MEESNQAKLIKKAMELCNDLTCIADDIERVNTKKGWRYSNITPVSLMIRTTVFGLENTIRAIRT